ncbi:uncharacterized protein EI90DRAFT_3069617 [Cantharellus anzutake]|uniref:uncharacterized protein n=1 Tax=Cantharellus anzutake TaxID=1750568 RepID=UPI0019084EE0|nr:uncharacterized protein EI90DRAFT_3069617 [Cantharellus anzutake]KAF8326553.1 hypothetical protein EI90DRAFT_3069617 [Cantharellus anzutake]
MINGVRRVDIRITLCIVRLICVFGVAAPLWATITCGKFHDQDHTFPQSARRRTAKTNEPFSTVPSPSRGYSALRSSCIFIGVLCIHQKWSP